MEWRLGDSLGISNRGTKAKTITSCDNAFVTNIVLARGPAAKRSGRGTKAKTITSCDNAFVTNILLPRRTQEALLCAKAKRQRQSAQSERKSTPRYSDESKNIISQ
ncbi:hypothetical protein ACQKMI_03560 [Lysinibacillus sp. NPDC097214]|uniref:hypothetical protein n=1 Tax=Lysinibacillus sp. NPDC097214 TaxID=3390584 RepID=UPI003D0881DF